MALTTAQTAAGRKSVPLLKAIFAETQPIDIVLTLRVVDKKKLTFTLAMACQTSLGAVVYDVATNDGKLKKYQDVDSAYRTAVAVAGARFAEGQTPVTALIVNQSVMIPEESIGGDPSARLAKEKLKLENAKATTDAKVADMAVDIAAVSTYQTGTPKEQAYYVELVAEQDVMQQLSDWYVARIAEIVAIIGP